MGHLKDQDMTYCEHFAQASTLSGKLCCGCLKTLIHAFIPDCFPKATTNTVEECKTVLENDK